MGQQTTETGITEIRYDNYIFQLRVLSEKEIGLEVVDTKTFKIFTIESYSFQQYINSSTLIAALKKQQESYIKMSIQYEQNSEKDIQLKVILRVSFDFIPSFEEVIILSIKKGGDSESDMIRTQMKIINEDIRDLQNSIDENTQAAGRKYVTQVKNREFLCDDENETNICQISLPKGRYEINLAFYSKYQQIINEPCFYAYLKNDKTQQYILNTEGIYYQISNLNDFSPHSLRSIVQVIEENQTFSFVTMYTQSYPWYLKNLILSATTI